MSVSFLARVGDLHTCPMCEPPGKPHIGGPVLPPGVPTVLVGGRPVAVSGGRCVCVGPPDSIPPTGSSVKIGGQFAARAGDATAHGGRIVIGCPTVLCG